MAWLLDKEVKRELPEEWNGTVPTNVFMEQAETIVRDANARNIPLRILGGLGVALHCPELRSFAKKLSRTGTGVVEGQEYSDIDLMSYRRHREEIKELFSQLGYAKRRATLSTAASERQIYYHPKGWFYVDVFFDKLLVANHPIDFSGRLELDSPTVTVTDMLLEKLQIWEAFSAKDLKDSLLLLKAHTVDDIVDEKRPRESIDAAHVARLLSGDWGFWYTATTNLERMKRFVSKMEKLGVEAGIDPTRFKLDEFQGISDNITKLLERIEREPKSMRWRMRAKIGAKQRWYNHVESEETVGGFGIWEALLKRT